MRPDGSGKHRFSPDGVEVDTTIWSPDSRSLITWSRDLQSLYRVTLDGAMAPIEGRALPAPPEASGLWLSPTSWSRDGESIAGAAIGADSRIRGVWTYHLSDGRLLRSAPELSGIAALFVPGSSRLVVESRGGLFLLDPVSNRLTEILAPGHVAPMVGLPVALSRDGRALAWIEETREADLSAAEIEEQQK